MSDVIPTGTTRDSEYVFDRMTQATLAATRPGPGRRILDVASGFGQDAIELQTRGAWVVGAEPSERMMAWTRMKSGEASGPVPGWVQAWGDALPFADDSFDAAFCKGALDHFDQPDTAIAEMARVTRPGGRVVLTIANYDSFTCRASRVVDDLTEFALNRPMRRGRRHYDVPNDHFTRYDLALMHEQLETHVAVDHVEGLSLAWGLPIWTRTIGHLPAGLADISLRTLDRIARYAPSLADVLILAGTPLKKAVKKGC
ncbi:MAG: class I SAM-dependent methyltransferase [bacterium]|nr:class I SAM-dependent methyltransferase [bacterium]